MGDNVQDSEEILLEEARTLVARLERLSADSTWAHRASGYRGALLKSMERLETGRYLEDGLEGNPSTSRLAETKRLEFLVERSFALLVSAAKEIQVNDAIPHS